MTRLNGLDSEIYLANRDGEPYIKSLLSAIRLISNSGCFGCYKDNCGRFCLMGNGVLDSGPYLCVGCFRDVYLQLEHDDRKKVDLFLVINNEYHNVKGHSINNGD